MVMNGEAITAGSKPSRLASMAVRMLVSLRPVTATKASMFESPSSIIASVFAAVLVDNERALQHLRQPIGQSAL